MNWLEFLHVYFGRSWIYRELLESVEDVLPPASEVVPSLVRRAASMRRPMSPFRCEVTLRCRLDRDREISAFVLCQRLRDRRSIFIGQIAGDGSCSETRFERVENIFHL